MFCASFLYIHFFGCLVFYCVVFCSSLTFLFFFLGCSLFFSVYFVVVFPLVVRSQGNTFPLKGELCFGVPFGCFGFPFATALLFCLLCIFSSSSSQGVILRLFSLVESYACLRSCFVLLSYISIFWFLWMHGWIFCIFVLESVSARVCLREIMAVFWL